jgi:hypothetical protein
VQAEKKITGPAGTSLVFDGFGLLHRGGLVEQAERIALQVVFAPAAAKQNLTARIKSRAGRVIYSVPILSGLTKALLARYRGRSQA